jgi:hypothetical protein
MAPDAAVDLYWIPLGAGDHCVRVNGRLYEAIAAASERRPRSALYHAALIVERRGERYAIELAPSWNADTASRGVVRAGAVGSRRLGRWRLFRYELRCWRGGSIPDLSYAVGGPHRLSSDPVAAERVLELTAMVPTPVWGRDGLGCGEMWNSNSVIAWLLAAAGIPTDTIEPPAGGRAPGWNAGLVAAHRSDPIEGRGSPPIASLPARQVEPALSITSADRRSEDRRTTRPRVMPRP